MEIKDNRQSADILPFVRKAIEDGSSGSDNWLSNLEPTTVFLTRPKRGMGGSMFMGPELVQFHVVYHSEKATVLLNNESGRQQFQTVDTQRFSNQYDLFEVLQYPITEEEKEGMDDNNVRSVSGSGMESDVDDQRSEQVARED